MNSDDLQENELKVSKQTIEAYEIDNQALQRINEAFEEANNSRQQMAEAVTSRITHLEKIIQQDEQSTAEEKVALAQETMAHTSSTVQSLSATLGEKFMECYKEVGDTKSQIAELKAENKRLEDQVEAERFHLARSQEDEAFWHNSLEEANTERQGLQTAKRNLDSIIKKRDQRIQRLEASAKRTQESYNETWDELQETKAHRDTLLGEVNVVSNQHETLTERYADLTRAHQDASSLKGFLEILVSCADKALNDGTNTLEQDWNPPAVSQRIGYALERIPRLEGLLDAEKGTSQDRDQQHLVQVQEAAAASAKAELLVGQLEEANVYGAKYLEEATTLRTKSDGLEKDNQRLSSSLNNSSTKLNDTEKQLTATREHEISLTQEVSTLSRERTSFKEQLDTARDQLTESDRRVTKLESQQEMLQKAVQDARQESLDDLQSTQQSLEKWKSMFHQARDQHENLERRYAGLEKKNNDLLIAESKLRSSISDASAWWQTRLQASKNQLTAVQNELDITKMQLQSLEGQGPEVEAKRQELVQREQDQVKEGEKLAVEREALSARVYAVTQQESTVRQLEREHSMQEGRLLQKETEIDSRLEQVNNKQQTFETERSAFRLEQIKLDNKVAEAMADRTSLTTTVESMEKDIEEKQKALSKLEERLASLKVTQESTENRLLGVQGELERAKQSIIDRQDEAAKNSMEAVKFMDENAKLQQQLLEAKIAAQSTLTETMAKVHEETNLSIRQATSQSSAREQQIQSLYTKIGAQVHQITGLEKKAIQRDNELMAYTREQIRLQSVITQKDQDASTQRTEILIQRDTIEDLKSDVARLRKKCESARFDQDVAEEDCKQTVEKLQAQVKRAMILEGDVETATSHIWNLLFGPGYGLIRQLKVTKWGTLRDQAGTDLNEVFPNRVTSVAKHGFSWTLSMCTQGKMSMYLERGFDHLLSTLSIVLPIHNQHQTALPIIEAMLHKVNDSVPGHLLKLRILFLTILSDDAYLGSDAHDLCEVRIMELILRIADRHGRYWGGVDDLVTRLDRRITARGTSPSVVVRAICAWSMAIENSVVKPTATIFSVPELLTSSIPDEGIQLVRASFAVAETQEGLDANNRSSRRTLLAGKLFSSMSAYFLADRAKHEAIMFDVHDTHYSIGSRTLTLPERFGHHHISGKVLNPGYTDDLGGTFDVPKPFICPSKLFVCDHMADVFEADHMR